MNVNIRSEFVLADILELLFNNDFLSNVADNTIAGYCSITNILSYDWPWENCISCQISWLTSMY